MLLPLNPARPVCLGALAVVGMLALMLLPAPAEAGRTEVTTGAMLGSGAAERDVYLRIDRGAWAKTYTGAAYDPSIRGRLMNFRAANALFDDEGRSTDDPAGNTARFVSQFDAYKRHGVLAFTVSLQGGYPGYDAGVVSAFRRDGSLKDAWLQRASQVIEAADARGQVVILTYFYQRQDEVLADHAAVRRAVSNATDWLIRRSYRNVIIEIANEYDSPLVNHGIIKRNQAKDGIAELVTIAQGRFTGKGWRLPVSASARDLDFDGALRAAADLALVHGNLTTPAEDEAGIRKLVQATDVTGPVVMNEDRNGDTVSEANLANERATATRVVGAGGSWGHMWFPYNQRYPFKWAHGSSTSISGGSMANYFLAVHDHIRSLTAADEPPPSEPAPAPSEPPASDASPTIASMTLIDADSDQPVPGYETLRSGAVLDLDELPPHLTIQANPAAGWTGVAAVRFRHNTKVVRDERVAPYALAGDTDGDFHAWAVSPGSHTVSATPLGGDSQPVGPAYGVSFEVVD